MTGAVAYRVQTPRLVLRCWSPEDARLVRESIDASDAHLRPWIPFMKHEPRTLEATATWLRARRAWFDRDEQYCYGVFDPSERELVGEAMLLTRVGDGALELGYWIDVRRSGTGLGTEASAALVRLAFEAFDVGRVEIHCSSSNPASFAIARKLGFRHEATLPDRFENAEGELQDQMVWTLFANDWPSSPAREVEVRAFDALGRAIALAPRS